MLKGFARVTRTNSGKTGIGLEVQVNGMNKYSELTKAQQKWFKDNGFRWMKALYEEKDGKWVKTRDGFFYASFKTKKTRDALAKKLEEKLVKAEKPATKKTEPKKTEKAEPKKSVSKMTKAEMAKRIAELEARLA